MTQQFSFLGSRFDSASDLHLAVARFHYRNVDLDDLVALDRDRVAVDRDYDYLLGELRREAEREDAREGERAALQAFDRAKLAEAIDELAIERADRVREDSVDSFSIYEVPSGIFYDEELEAYTVGPSRIMDGYWEPCVISYPSSDSDKRSR